MLTVIKTTHRPHPWRLAWHGRPIDDVHFRRQREAFAACRDLMSMADFALPGPDAWAPAIQERVAAYVAALPCVVELDRLRQERAPGPR